MAMFVGIALLAPFVIVPAIRLLAAPLRRLAPAAGRLAADSVLSNPGRTAATALARLRFAVAVAAVVLGTLAAIITARRAARLKTIDALSYE